MTIALIALALYAAAGVVIALAFVIFGVTRVQPEPLPVTVGARILIFPGAAALWPYVLVRWLKSAPMRRAHRSVHRVLWPVLAWRSRSASRWRWCCARRPMRSAARPARSVKP